MAKKHKASPPSTKPANSACGMQKKKAKQRGYSDFQPSQVLKRLDALEKKVDTLKRKPYKMHYHKEDLLTAAVYRADTLEAELIATKKALHEALAREQELLAYIQSQEAVKFQKKMKKQGRKNHPYIPYYLHP